MAYGFKCFMFVLLLVSKFDGGHILQLSKAGTLD